MKEFFLEYWQWIIGSVLVPVLAVFIENAIKKQGRKQRVGDIHGSGNQVINGDVKQSDKSPNKEKE